MIISVTFQYSSTNFGSGTGYGSGTGTGNMGGGGGSGSYGMGGGMLGNQASGVNFQVPSCSLPVS